MKLLRAARVSTQTSVLSPIGVEYRGLIPAVLLAVVFLLDFSQRADVVFSVLYVLPIISTISVGRPAATYVAFVASSVATVAAAGFGLQPEHTSAAFSNRTLALLAQVVAAGAVIQHMTLQRQKAVTAGETAERVPLDALSALSDTLAPLPDALALIGMDGIIHTANAAALRLLGIRISLVQGRPWSSLVPMLQPLAADGAPLSLPQSLLQWPCSGPETVSADVVLRRGESQVLERFTLTGMVLRDTRGALFGALVLARDVSAEHARDQERDAFISMAAHELRAPLSTLRGYAQLAQNNAIAAGVPSVATTIQKALKQADRLNRMIGELLDIARLHRAQIDLHYTVTDLEALLRDAVEQRRAADPARVITLMLIDEVPPLKVDAPRLQQVFANLLDNAIKYSPDGGPVEVALRRVQDTVEVCVSDHGIGIPQEEQELLFQQFYRGKNGAHRFSGLGVGLYISHQIIVQHGGELAVRSTSGEGSMFTCTLPVLPPSGRLRD